MNKLMIVDDHEYLLKTLEYALQDDFEIAIAHTAWDCMLQVPLFQPQVMILDYKLPDINGLELIQQLMSTNYKPSIILMSSWMDAQLAERAEKLGAKGCLGKPFEMKDLKETLDRLVASTLS